MKTYWNKVGTEILFDIEDEDIPKITEIMNMMNSDGWKYLGDYLSKIREELINKGKECTLKKSQKDFSENRWAMINGFDINTRFVDSLIMEIEELMRIKKDVSEVEQNAN